MTNIPWPVAVLDFEASGISRFSYPIDVGFARWRGFDTAIESWGTLIRPGPDWRQDGFWSANAEAVHKIKREDLDTGLFPEAVCARLNHELAGCIVCCDGYSYDHMWLAQLYDAANSVPTFHLESMVRLYHAANPGLAKWLGQNRHVPHRAREDAERLMRAFAYGVKHRPKRIVLP